MWEERFRRLIQWKNTHGHCAVPIAQGELGTWVSKQRQLRKRGKLSNEKVDALDSLSFTWSTAEADWEEKFKRLCQWKVERGNASVPFNEGELGWWVNTQRQCKRKGKLSPSREARLHSLGFVWNPSNSRSRAPENENIHENNNIISTSDTTLLSTTEKLRNLPSENTNAILQLFENEPKPIKMKSENESCKGSPSSVSGVRCPDIVTLSLSCSDALTSSPHGMLSQSLWSPSLISSPVLMGSSLTSSCLPQSHQTQLSLGAMSAFSTSANVQNQTDVLEQFLARDDGFIIDQSHIDSLICEEEEL